MWQGDGKPQAGQAPGAASTALPGAVGKIHQ